MKRKSLSLVTAALIAAVALVVAAPAVKAAVYEWRAERRAAAIAAALEAVRSGSDATPSIEPLDEGVVDPDPDHEDSLLRQLILALEFGQRTPQSQAAILNVAHAEARRWAPLMPGADLAGHAGPVDRDAPSPTPAGAAVWRNLGPGSARFQFNGTLYYASDSGRPNVVRIDPANQDFAYVGTSGGGLWATTNFNASDPTWTPLTDTLGALAIGVLEISPSNANSLWVGLGDFFDQRGGQLVHGTRTITANVPSVVWDAPISLLATPPFQTASSQAFEIRDLKIDPLHTTVMLAATDVGLFRSTDSGATWTWVDLPNAGATPNLMEALWSIVYLGDNGTAGSWALGGVYACAATSLPNTAGLGSPASATCAGGNLGDIWTSVDGATWVSARAAGGLPAAVSNATTGGGRMALAAYAGASVATSVVYAQVSSINEAASSQIAILKSTAGSLATATPTFTSVATATTVPVNPTTGTDCANMNLAHAQAWYNLAIAVDPADPNNVIVGGDLCSARTINGGTSWELTSHWLPSSGRSSTTVPGAIQNALPYVHADWHVAFVSRIGGKLQVLVGTDGGIFVSYDLFSATAGNNVHWGQPDVGLITHLTYSLGSGDPTLGNPAALYTGLQDNGTRIREAENERNAIIFADTFDQILGGDGTGDVIASDANGQNVTYWGSVQQSRRFCKPRLKDCNQPTHFEGEGVEFANWRALGALGAAPDGEPFVERYSATFDTNGSVISYTNRAVFRIATDLNDQVFASRLTPAAATGVVIGGAIRTHRGVPYAMPIPTTTLGGRPARIYGFATSGGGSYLIIDDGVSSNTSATPTQVVIPPTLLNVLDADATTQFVQSTTSVAIPRDPSHFGPADPTKVWFVSSVATVTLATATVPSRPISTTVGHLFKTIDGGATWQPFHGNGTSDLPNVPVYVVRFDPSDPTDQTIYAGTELGLYRSTDAGLTWARYGAGLPLVRITDMHIAQHGAVLRVSTYGRGIWELQVRNEAGLAAGNGDWDKNGIIDFADVLNAGARLGSTPLTQTANYAGIPRYDYDNSLDLTGNPAQIEEADLTAIVAKFGSAP
jgi:type II secretory pathway pseudopilin PulG